LAERRRVDEHRADVVGLVGRQDGDARSQRQLPDRPQPRAAPAMRAQPRRRRDDRCGRPARALTGRPDVPEHKRARGYTYEADKFTAAELTPAALGAGMPAGVAETPIHLEGRVRAIHPIEGEDSGLRALEVEVLRTHVDERLLMDGHPAYI